MFGRDDVRDGVMYAAIHAGLAIGGEGGHEADGGVGVVSVDLHGGFEEEVENLIVLAVERAEEIGSRVDRFFVIVGCKRGGRGGVQRVGKVIVVFSGVDRGVGISGRLAHPEDASVAIPRECQYVVSQNRGDSVGEGGGEISDELDGLLGCWALVDVISHEDERGSRGGPEPFGRVVQFLVERFRRGRVIDAVDEEVGDEARSVDPGDGACGVSVEIADDIHGS